MRTSLFAPLALAMATLAPASQGHEAATADPAQTIHCRDDAGWDDPATPQRIYGNTWYVGTCGISAILVTSPGGHVLIDGGTAKGGALVLANIRALGFNPEDVRAIVFSHEHFDHAGGLAELQAATGATVMARASAVDTLRRGASDRQDPQFLVLESFPAVGRVEPISDNELVKVGSLALQAIPTPGHTAGGTSWTWLSCVGEACQQIVYADSVTAISDDVYRYSDEAAHPGVVARFRETLARVSALNCDILVTPHPSASNLWARMGPDASAPLVDTGACRAYAQKGSERLDKRLADEAGASTKPPSP